MNTFFVRFCTLTEVKSMDFRRFLVMPRGRMVCQTVAG